MTTTHGPAHHWRIAPERTLTLDGPHILAIINATPDSFSDGGRHLDPGAALDRIHAALAEGATIIDVGGESTRPGADSIAADEQIARTVPIIEGARTGGVTAPISIDTTRAEVARAALDAGADIINDQSAGLDDPAMLTLAAQRGAAMILMHRATAPKDDRWSTDHTDQGAHTDDEVTVTRDLMLPGQPPAVVIRVRDFLRDRIEAARAAGVDDSALVIDPGLGFGKSVHENYTLIAHTSAFADLGRPLLSAASRKSFIGAVSGVEEPSQRFAGSIAASLAHYQRGVRLFRVHDVSAHAQALRVAAAIPNAL